jgi:hypothetical protein
MKTDKVFRPLSWMCSITQETNTAARDKHQVDNKITDIVQLC